MSLPDFAGDIAAKALAKVQLSLVTFVFMGLSFVLAGALLVERLQGMPVYFVSLGGAQIVRPGLIPELAAQDYAANCLAQRYTFTPKTARLTYKQVYACLHPRLRERFKAQEERELKDIKDKEFSSQIVVIQQYTIEYRPKRVLVGLQAIRTISIAGQWIKDEVLDVEVVVEPYYSAGMPTGLTITDVPKAPPDLQVVGMK